MSVPAGTLDTGGRRPPERRIRLLLIGLLALMTVAAGLLGVLYTGAANDASTAEAALTTAQTDTKTATTARQKADDAREDAETRATTAETERDAAQSTAQTLQDCQQAAKDLLVALNGPDNQATTDAARDALTRMTNSCQ